MSRLKVKSLPKPKDARAALGISQRELARRVPTTQASVFRFEKEGHYPKHRALRAAYLAALGLAEESKS